MNWIHKELLSNDKLVSCQKYVGRLFTTEEEKIFSEQFWHMLGGSNQNIVDQLEGMELEDNSIYDSFARRAHSWHTPETDEPLPFRKNCRWAVGFSLDEKPTRKWKYSVKEWLRSDKHWKCVRLIERKLLSLAADMDIDEKVTYNKLTLAYQIIKAREPSTHFAKHIHAGVVLRKKN